VCVSQNRPTPFPGWRLYEATKIKSGTNDYVGEGTHMQILVTLTLLGGASPHMRNITFRTLPISFFNVMLIFEQGYRWDRWTDFNAQYLKTSVSAGSAYLWGQNNNFTILGVKIPQNSPKLARIGISQRNPPSRKIAIYRSTMKLFASNLTHRLKNEEKYPKSAKLGQKESCGGHVTHF